MRQFLVVLFVMALFSGCVTTAFQHHAVVNQAAKDFKCDKRKIVVRYLGEKRVQTIGCGVMAIYSMNDCKIPSLRSICKIVQEAQDKSRPKITFIWSNIVDVNGEKEKRTQSIEFRQEGNPLPPPKDKPVPLPPMDNGNPFYLHAGWSYANYGGFTAPKGLAGMLGLHFGVSAFLSDNFYMGLLYQRQNYGVAGVSDTAFLADSNSYREDGLSTWGWSKEEAYSLYSAFYEFRMGFWFDLPKSMILDIFFGIGANEMKGVTKTSGLYWDRIYRESQYSFTASPLSFRLGVNVHIPFTKVLSWFGKSTQLISNKWLAGVGLWLLLSQQEEPFNDYNALFFNLQIGYKF